MKSCFRLLPLLVLLAVTPAMRAQTYIANATFDGYFSTSITVNHDTGLVAITMAGPTNAWFGLTFDGYYSSQGYTLVSNAFSVGNYFEGQAIPFTGVTPLATQSATATYEVESSTTTFYYTRSTAAATASHFSFDNLAAGPMAVAWAVGNRPFDMPYAHGQTTITFAEQTAVPEPATYATLAGVTVLGFAAYRRRRSA